MRIITGKYKGRNLSLVPGISTRPTTSFNREVIFSVYQDYEDCKVLDLFAGTGSLGLETLSRGAAWVDFVEFAPAALSTILANIAQLNCGDSCHLWKKRVEAYLKTCTKQYDVIFLDPPYLKNLVNPSLSSIFERNILAPGGFAVVEHSPLEPIAPSLQGYVCQQKESKGSHFTWLAMSPHRK